MPAQRLALVTGASSGIGRATALLLGARGWRVVLVARSEAKLTAVRDRIVDAGGDAHVEVVDAGDADAVLAMADRIRDRFGVPGAIVNCAGLGQWKFMEDTPPDEMEAMLAAPFKAAYHVTYAFLRDLLDQGAGVFVHVGSPASVAPWPGTTGYAISRWALRGLHESLAIDLHGTGVHSCHVVFGEVASEYWEHNPGTAEGKPTIERFLPAITPEETAEVIVRTIDRPRPEVFHPPVIRALALSHRVVPGATRWLLRRTGKRRG
jgi:uncharacterized protein